MFIIIFLLLLGTAGYYGYRYQKSKIAATPTKRQAVFLTSGQVYFGYLSNANKTTVTLRNIYYLKTPENPEEENAAAENSKTTLVKLGDELHGPEDIMYINRDQILFYETMKDDSQVNQAISKMQ